MPGPAEAAAAALGITYKLVHHGPAGSLLEAAAAQGIPAGDLVKTLVVRRGEGDFLFVLVPGDRVISWPKLRALLGVNRLALPDAATAKAATGYERGTITPFGSSTPWPVIADVSMRGRVISLGAGERGVALQVSASSAVAALGGTFADVTEAA
ncbi:YbaK/EbsC family protein [Actinoplanes sp. NPDC051411]|uniref:aminoacyl-tRNA deacylase n=1 Tax=Actinoplanes sp. NPDC051411 TaxID=3155522 RepID=UPI0034463C87